MTSFMLDTFVPFIVVAIGILNRFKVCELYRPVYFKDCLIHTNSPWYISYFSTEGFDYMINTKVDNNFVILWK